VALPSRSLLALVGSFWRPTGVLTDQVLLMLPRDTFRNIGSCDGSAVTPLVLDRDPVG